MNAPLPQVVHCPKCGRKQKAGRTADSLYWCEWCKGYFDNEPDEGGDFSDRNPSARLEREERRQQNQRKPRR